MNSPIEFWSATASILLFLAGLLMSTVFAGQILSLFLQRFIDQLGSVADEGLRDGGYWIGILERALIYLFVMIGEPASIGFLVAAKSIFRIGEVKEAAQRKLAEYILIGTLASFAAATVFGLLTRLLFDCFFHF
ncbi:MAG: hypothetical protein AAGI88_14445 [Pseudomonadota bacterium]